MKKKTFLGVPLFLAITGLLALPAARAQSAFSNAVMNLNPVAYWPLQETAQPPAPDMEINLGSLGAPGNAIYSSTNVIKGMTPIPGDPTDFAVASSITANGSFLAVPTAGGASTLPAGPFAVEIWVNPTNVSTAATIIAQTGVSGSGGLNGGANSAGWSLNVGYIPSLGGITMPGTICFHVYNGVGFKGGAEATFTSSSFTAGSWAHIVGVFDGTNAFLEVNGVPGSSIQPMTGTQALDTWDPLTIGCGRGLNNNKFGGSMDEVAIYTNALSAGQITAHYNAGNGGGNYKNTILADHPYMYWRMDAPAYTTPDSTAYPGAINYGSGVGINGLYLSGTTPGMTGPTGTGFGSPSYACAFNGIGTDSTNAIPIFTNGVAYSTNAVSETGVIITNLLNSLNLFTNSMSYMCWFKENPADNHRNVLFGHSDNGWRTSMDGGGHVTANTTGKGTDSSSSPLVYNDGNWHFAVIVYTNTGLAASPAGWLATNYLYVDGVLASTALMTNANSIGSLTNIMIGCAPDHTRTGNGNTYDNQILAGSLAHVAYFSNALSAADVANLYTTATGVPPAPVITGQPITGRTNSPGTGNNGSGPGSFIFMGVQYVGATSLQWYFNSSSNYAGATLLPSDNVKYFGTTTANMTVTNLVDSDSGYYFVVLGNGFGSVTSILASFTVKNEPFITSQTPSGGTLQLFQNQNFTLSVTAGGTNLTYQWYTNSVADMTAGTSPSYTLTSVQTAMSGNTYYCVAANQAGTATSGTVTLAVQPLPAAVANDSYPSNILVLNPSGYWPLHEAASGVAGDVETNLGSLGNLANGYYADWATPLTNIVHGVSGGLSGESDPSVLFNNTPNAATPGYLVIPRTSPATTLKPPFTLEAWVKPINAGFGDIISQGPWNLNAGGSTSGPRYGVRMAWGSGGNSANTLADFQIYVGPGTVSNPDFPTTVTQALPIGNWYHIALTTSDGTNWLFFVNGNQHFSFVLPMAVDTGDPIVVGQGLWQNNGPQRGFPGAIDEVAIYTNALDPNEILRHYNIGAGLDTSTTYKQAVLATNPVVYLRMDAPAYTAPATSSWSVATNYGTTGGNGAYSPGSLPGLVTGPNAAGIIGKNVMPGNGMSSFVDLGNSAAFNPTGAAAFSYGAWFQGNPLDGRSFQTIMGRSDSSFRAAINSAGKLQAHAGATDVTSAAIYNDGLWHQFVMTYTGTNTTYNSTNTGALGVNTLYVDGVQIGQTVGTNNNGTTAVDAMVGDDPGNTNNPIGTGRSVQGQICEAAFWSGVSLSSNQVVGLYNASATAPAISKQPTSASVNANGNFTNSVTVFGSSPLYYQWYRDNLPLPIGGQTNLPLGATNANLAISPAKGSDASSDYYVVITNSAGSVTSSIVSLTVFTQPVFTNEPILVTQTNNIQLFAGALPTFKVGTVGALPTYYQWFTNGVAATPQGTNLTSYNLSVEPGLANFSCVASNFVGMTTDTLVSVTVLADPTAPYPQAVLVSSPIGYWRLNEPDQGGGNAGAIANDYLGGNNGIYTNTDLGQPGYSPASDPSTTSARFGFDSLVDDDAYGISGIDFGAPTNSNVAFTVEAWVNGYTQTKDAGIVSKGYGGSEQFDLDLGSHVTVNGQTTFNFRFFVRDASGATHLVNSSVPPSPGAQVWHHLVGVCDEPHSNVTLYVDGASVGSAAIAPGSGILSSARAMIIGSRPSNATTNANDLNFVGFVNDVAVYNYALSVDQVAAHYASAGVPPNLSQVPPASISVDGFGSMTLPAGAVGTPPLSYTWFDTLHGTNVATGSTNGNSLDATLTVTNVPLGWNGDTLELTVQNSFGSTNVFVALTVFTNAPAITSDLPPQVSVVSGKQYQYSISVVGPHPIHYQWFNGPTLLGNQTNSTYSLVAGSPGSTTYYVIVTNNFGAVTSTISTFTSIAQLSGYPYATNVLSLNPVGYWPLQETNAQAPATIETNFGLLGALGNAYYAATNINTVSFNQAGAIFGDTDPSVLFTAASSVNGSITNINSYAFVPRTTPALTLVPPFSMECWVNSSSTGFGDLMGEGGGTGLNAANGAGNFGGARLSWGGNNGPGPNLQFYVSNGNSTTRNAISTPANSVTFGAWHHCVATYDGTTAIIYIDGVQQANDSTTLAGANTLNPDTWSPFTIGGAFWQNNGPNRETYATMDEVAVYTNILSPTQVSSHYQAGTTTGNYLQTITNDRPLLYYRMDCPGFTNTPASACPEAVNYGSALANGSYLSGVAPGAVSGPSNSVLGSVVVAASINGVISCVDAGSDPSFNPSGTNSFTAVTWFKAYPADDRPQAIMSHGVTNWAMNLDGTTGRLVWNLFFTGGQVTSTTILNDGNWHFVAGVYDRSTSNSYLYVDGQLNASLPVTGTVASEPNAHLYLGGSSDFTLVGNNQRYFGGALAQAAFFTNALSSTQIQSLFAGGIVTPTIGISRSGSNLSITYTGTLLSSTNVIGPYSPVSGASSPYPVSTTGPQMFYRAGP